ncbi:MULTISPECIES: response regulator [unclassified Rhizobacter]|uniref:hybrid sensor histidine kinase/response regulator n=1 Tax=unclassified Rhizobacter TaxID=2640088 RepID=UPI0006F56C65|nr:MULTISPECIES: response regulator [unclassified Rhizobacter]KQU73455.1 hypothetical protein ASC88_04370 [Rhizobacter sp. Root29]KQV98640.1 hypothetical protein ASC98_08200 [Rhizobacter sp. Root1238]KRB04893.1 hypothetical protein ASE08_13355 [Rhizobacter sp. Root16D2]
MSTEFRPIDRSAHTLLIVDDDPVSRYATVRLLHKAGFQTREAGTGAEGLAAADAGISAMVLDVHLPDIDGFELCRRLRSRPDTARIPVLHLSAAYVTDDDKVRGLDSGADAYLTHPVEPAVLVATVQALVRARRAEEGMRLSEAKFRAIYAQVPAGICLLDAQARIVDANPAMLRFLGRPFDAVAGQPLKAFALPEQVPVFDAWIARHAAAAAGDDTRAAFSLLAADGSRTELEWTLTPHIERDAMLAVATDITHRGAIERQQRDLMEREQAARSDAERISRMKDELIAVLSHELRTPLNAMLGWTHVLQKRGGNEETVRGLDAIERNGRMQARMISDILDMSRLNLGKMPLLFEPMDPVQVVTTAVDAMQPSLDENGQRVVLDVQPPHRAIRADSARIQQVVWNLLSNAIKFSPKGSEIRVSLRDRPDGLTLTVADQGQGVEAEFLPLLFERFTQGDAGSNRRRGGLGLGLSIVEQLVEAHGGAITAHSEGVGRGTQFVVELPTDAIEARQSEAADTSADEMASPGQAETGLVGIHVLIVDDDPDACAMLGIILGDRGATVSTANGFDEALTVLKTLRPDVLVSDIGMPGQDGYALMRRIRADEAATQQPRLPSIALTSFTRMQDENQAIAAGFDLHCPKPLRPLKLLQAVESLVGRHEARPPPIP